MDADLFTKGAMAAHDGEKSTGNKIFCIVVMCSGFAFVRSGPKEPPIAGPTRASVSNLATHENGSIMISSM